MPLGASYTPLWRRSLLSWMDGWTEFNHLLPAALVVAVPGYGQWESREQWLGKPVASISVACSPSSTSVRGDAEC
ncbi:unnamed protein product [Protopolystoma xenopodis]|uniref:Uncharacterized protein n=1 Tax=Protopolystoma xenopodis TaxID=117903 RepID=A0A448XF66_9PLAT|nr:unnamed protein product [Protopolystoma xenopodis]